MNTAFLIFSTERERARKKSPTAKRRIMKEENASHRSPAHSTESPDQRMKRVRDEEREMTQERWRAICSQSFFGYFSQKLRNVVKKTATNSAPNKISTAYI